MEKQNFFAKKLLAACGKHGRSCVPLLMGRIHKRHTAPKCKCLCSADARQKAGHIASFHRAGLLGDAYSIYFCKVKFRSKLCEHLRQRCRMVKERIALPQPKLAIFYGQKTFFCANNLSGCIKYCQRGCIVAGIYAQCIAHDCSGSSCGSLSSRPASRTTAPNRPLTNL